MLFKLSNLNSNLTLTLGYLNPALNNSAQEYNEGLSKNKYHWIMMMNDIECIFKQV